jgi:hypothetical protein
MGFVLRGLHSLWTRVLLFIVRPSAMPVVLVLVMAAYVLAFISTGALGWLALVLFAPGWLLPNASAVSVTAQVLPALIVSIFVFILGSFFLVTQLATTIHSNRASLLLLYDPPVQKAVVRPLVISVATLFLALVSPGEDVQDSVAAFALVLMVATALTLWTAATLLPYLITRVTAPRNFVLFVLEPVEDLLTAGATGLVVYRVGLLGEMLKRGVRSGDSVQIRQALGGLDQLSTLYVSAASTNEAARVHQYDNDDEPATGWLGEELVPLVVSGGQEAIGLDIANEDGNRIASLLARFAIRSAEARHTEEYERAVDGLGELGTCTQQMKVPGLINVYSEVVFGLASQVQPALSNLGDEQAARALAVWALVIAYDVQHLGATGHVFWEQSVRMWPDDTPWSEARDRVKSEEFQNAWANKLAAIRPIFEDEAETKLLIPGGPEGVAAWLAVAEDNLNNLDG